MNTEHSRIVVGRVPVEVVRKDIKNLHLGVYPPHGRVRIAVPVRTKNETVRLAVVRKLTWIKRQQKKFHDQERQSRREMSAGETHFFQGSKYRLRIREQAGRPSVQLINKNVIQLTVPEEMTAQAREKLLQGWYRTSLKSHVPALLQKWTRIMQVEPEFLGIRKMKTKWGSCNPVSKRIWLNLELAKKPPQCLEYVLVHELVHLLERKHGERFIALMDKFMPRWRLHRKELNRAPLSHEEWGM